MTDADRAAFDPFAAAPPAGFPADRWQRAGATAEEIAALSAAFAGSSAAARQGEVDAIASHSDYELMEAVAAQRHTGDWVGFTGTGTPTAAASQADETAPDDDESGSGGGDDERAPDDSGAPEASLPDVGKIATDPPHTAG